MCLIILTIFNSPFGIFSLEYLQPIHDLSFDSTQISITFVSPDKNLGIVVLPFTKQYLLPESPVYFALIDADDRIELLQSDYVKKNFSDLPKFPFGIPPIPDSANKKFLITLQFQSESEDPPLEIDPSGQVRTVHMYRDSLSANEVPAFLWKKFWFTFAQYKWETYLLITILGIVLPYVFSFVFPNPKFAQTRPTITYVLFTAQLLISLVVLLLPHSVTSWTYILWFSIQLVVSVVLGFSSKIIYSMLLFLLFFLLILISLYLYETAERVSVYTFLLFLFALVLNYIEISRCRFGNNNI